MMNSISQGNLDKDDIIIEEPKSSAGQDEKKKSISSAEATPVIHSGKFESQRNEPTTGVHLISPIKNTEQNHLNTIEQKPLTSMDFLESLKTNQYYNKPTYSRSFADVAIE